MNSFFYFRKEWENVDKDTVILHQFWRGKFCPNLSPYALKIESFIRLAKIKYVVSILYLKVSYNSLYIKILISVIVNGS